MNPQFDALQQPETYLNHIQEMMEEKDTAIFPVDVFPATCQRFIFEYVTGSNAIPDFVGCSILFSASVAIGNTHRIDINGSHPQSACLYIACVADSGSGKTHSVYAAASPLSKRDVQAGKAFEKARKQYNKLMLLNKKEREAQGQGQDEPEPPVLKQLVFSDFTPESLAAGHKDNLRGIGVQSDELAAWFKNFNRYNKGSEQETYLTVWSGFPLRINRKSSGPIIISKPFVSVIGTIQPGVVHGLFDGRVENGFVSRFLFAYTEKNDMATTPRVGADPQVQLELGNIINKLLDLPLNLDEDDDPEPVILRFSDEACERFFDWDKWITDLANAHKDRSLNGIIAKLKPYCARLSLILQLLYWACDEEDKTAIGITAVEGAIKLCDYFLKMAIRVRTIVDPQDSPYSNLPMDKQELYDALPVEFTTSEGVAIAVAKGIPERTFEYLLSKEELFTKIQQGKYRKKF